MSEYTDETLPSIIANSEAPVLVCFMSSFCGPSQSLFPSLDSVIENGAGDFEYVEVDVEKVPRMTRLYEVKGTPSLIFFNKGEPIGSRVGTMSDAFLETFITDMRKRIS